MTRRERFKSRKERLGRGGRARSPPRSPGFKSRKERLGQLAGVHPPGGDFRFKSRKERLGPPPPVRGGVLEDVSNPGRNVWDSRSRRYRRTRRRSFKSRKERLGHDGGNAVLVLYRPEFQIPEGTFGTAVRSRSCMGTPGVSNPGRNVWDRRALGGNREVIFRFKSRKERLGRCGVGDGHQPDGRVSNPGRNVWDADLP